MHICIVGTGAAGWITYHSLKRHANVDKITVIGSPQIPTIGVGESTTLSFYRFLHVDLGLGPYAVEKLLIDIDAAIKYGVSYEGWSKHTFLHHLGTDDVDRSLLNNVGYLLGNKPEQEPHNNYAVPLHKHIYDNKICLDRSLQGFSYHFDAGKFIQAMKTLALKDKVINYIEDTVTDLIYQGDTATEAVLESGKHVQADYFVSCVGQTAFNQKIFGESYEDYGDVLLTNKALFCPLKYTDRYKEFHPYTKARTMPHGWRWITPTRSRIGTGYAFSDRHITQGQAVDEFRKDTGIPDLEPFVIDFAPRKIKTVFKKNTCSLGMAGGFLEPLDAPGLSLTFSGIKLLGALLANHHKPEKQRGTDAANLFMKRNFDFWASFILHQYKTSVRQDTNFWKDHKQVRFDAYEKLIQEVFNPLIVFDAQQRTHRIHQSNRLFEPWMFYNTTSGKDIPWQVKSSQPLPTLPEVDISSKLFVDHRIYFDKMLCVPT